MTQPFIERLQSIRSSQCDLLPIRGSAESFAIRVLGLFFPHFKSTKGQSATVAEELKLVERELLENLSPLVSRLPSDADEIARKFIDSLPALYERLCKDAEAIWRGDPAAHSVDEVILAYPGFLAIAIFRIAHELHSLGVPIFPRMLTEFGHRETGIDIHPGATIGEAFFIDHGTGIVVGETTVIRDNVKLYQGVTLGALSVDKDMAQTKRHPTIENNVIIYSNATILGGNTVIGHDSIIGGNVWVTSSVPPHSTVYHKAEVSLKKGDE